MAIPVAAWPASAQGAGPNVNAVLNTFLPEARGVIVPLKLHPRLEAAVNVPLAATVIATPSPVSVIVDHEPVTVDRLAALA